MFRANNFVSDGLVPVHSCVTVVSVVIIDVCKTQNHRTTNQIQKNRKRPTMMLRQAVSRSTTSMATTTAAATAAVLNAAAWPTLGRRIQRSNCKRWLSEAAAARQKTGPGGDDTTTTTAAADVVFQYPKAQAMFQKIVMSFQTADQWRVLQDTMLSTLGRQRRAKEFYYDGFGGGKRNRQKGGAGDEVEAAPAAPSAFDVKLIGFDATAKIKVIKGMACCCLGGRGWDTRYAT
jgi:hypothetical protein